MKTTLKVAATIASALVFSTDVQAETLRLLTWEGYAPDAVVERFTAETGIRVEVTTSDNEDIIAQLRANNGGGFDLAQPSQDRITGAQLDLNIYQPMDMSKIDTSLFIPSMLKATQSNTTVHGVAYGVPHIWGTSGLVLDTAVAAEIKDYTDLCDSKFAGRISYRLKRPTLLGFAFAMGLDPFAAYGDEDAYQNIMDRVEAKLIACKANVETHWQDREELTRMFRSGDVVASMAWDTDGWQLNSEHPSITFVAPESGALGWIDTFAMPRGSEAEDAAYKWINFVMQPRIAALITKEAGNFTVSKGADAFAGDVLKTQFRASYPKEAILNIKWYPTVPAGLKAIENAALDRIRSAK